MQRLFSECRLMKVLLFLVMIFILFSGLQTSSSEAREGLVRRVAVLAFASPFLKSYEGLRVGLEQRGYTLDEDILFEVHSLDRDLARVVPLVKKFLEVDYDLIFTITTPVTQAVQAALLKSKKNIPVVFTAVADPLGSKVVTDLRNPGGNFTGVSHLSIELLPQRLLLFKKAFPGLRRAAIFFDPQEEISKRSFNQGYLQQAATGVGVELMVNHVRNHDEMLSRCRSFTDGQADGLFMLPDALSVAHFKELLELSHRLKIPLMVIDNMLLPKGGVIGYSPDFHGVGLQAAGIVDQIFKGIAPGQIAVQNPDKVKLVVSLKEAQLLGLEVSDEILLQADEVLR